MNYFSNMSQGLRLLSAAALVSIASLGVPSTSFAGSNGENAARNTMGAIYGTVGNRACGKKCGTVGRGLGTRVFDGAQWITNQSRDAGQYGGRKVRERYCRKRNCN